MASNDVPEASSRVTLQSLLKSTSPGNLQNALLTALPRMTEDQFKVLSDILSPLAATSTVPNHCVRCHKAFYENQNHPQACGIKHNKEPIDEVPDDYDEDIFLTLSCCDEIYAEDDVHPEGFCFVTTHTTNPDEVEYYNSDGEGNENVITCKKKGCSKKKRKGSQGMGRPTKKKKVCHCGFS
jgi:hypothetical protein